MATPWDHVRALLIVAHLAAITIASVPTPEGELTESRRRDPMVRDAIAPWSALVRQVGLAEDEDAAVDWLFDRGKQLVVARRTALGPVTTWLRFSGNAQSWRMFGAVPIEHGRFEIYGLGEGDTWRPLYIENTEYQWAARLLNQSRIRALRSNFASKDLRGRYNGFARLLAKRALDEHPELQVVRVQLRTVKIPPPKKLRESGLTEGRAWWSVQVSRE